MSTNLDRPAKVIEPALRMDPISAERFLSQEYLRAEWTQMWMRTWHIGGMAYQAPQPGDYLGSDLGPESALLIRQPDSVFSAKYTVSRPRAECLLAASHAQAQKTD